MNVKIGFGECLKQLLLIREWSASRLAREINTEPSYVRMWVRGERVPSIQSEYVHVITSALINGLDSMHKKSVHNSFRQYFTHFVTIGADENRPIAELMEMVLKNAQIYSLSTKQKKNNNRKRSKDITGQILNLAESGTAFCEQCADNGPIPMKVDDIPPYIEGRYSILCAVISILQASINRQNNNTGEIIITYQSNPYIFDGYHIIYETWKSLITEALRRKWKIRYLYRINKNSNRSLKLVQEIFNWSGYKNNFLPYFFTNFFMTKPPLEMMVIKKVGAFIFLAANNEDNIDKALFFKQSDIVNALYEYLKSVHSETNPMIKFFPKFYNYIEFISIKSRKQGDFYATSPDLYFCTVPVSLWEKYMGTLIDQDVRERHLKRMIELCRVFHEDVKKYKIKFICQLEVLEWMVESQDYFLQYFCQKPSPEDFLEHLEYTVHLLKKYKNFEIALVSENQDNVILPAVAWEVRGGRNAGMVSVDMENHYDFVYLAITEETVAEAFSDYFLETWEKITPKHRDKDYVILWFEEKVQYLREKLGFQVDPEI